MVDVIPTNDVIVAKVGADLYLDNLKGDLAWVFKPVPLSCRDVYTLVLPNELFNITDRYLGGTLHHDPML